MTTESINNLSQLKKHADKYSWTMISHDWMKNGKLIGVTRKIIKKQTNAFQFEGKSWLHLEKASGYTFSQQEDSVILTVALDDEGNVMTYKLDPLVRSEQINEKERE